MILVTSPSYSMSLTTLQIVQKRILAHLEVVFFSLKPYRVVLVAREPLLLVKAALVSSFRRLQTQCHNLYRQLLTYPGGFPGLWATLSNLALYQWLRPLQRFIPYLSPYTRYPTLAAEQAYWRSAARWRRRLYWSNARAFDPPRPLTPIPVVESYVPRLLPVYREEVQTDEESCEYVLQPTMFRKWHRMVYPSTVRSAARSQLICAYLHSRNRLRSPSRRNSSGSTARATDVRWSVSQNFSPRLLCSRPHS